MKKLLLVLLSFSTAAIGQIAVYPHYSQIVVGNMVAGATASVALTTVYTVPATGIYELCGGWLATSAGSAGATLQVVSLYTSGTVAQGPGLSSAFAATTIGNNSSQAGANTGCLTILAAVGTPIKVGYTIGGSPATNPTYTYWYQVTRR